MLEETEKHLVFEKEAKSIWYQNSGTAAAAVAAAVSTSSITTSAATTAAATADAASIATSTGYEASGAFGRQHVKKHITLYMIGRGREMKGSYQNEMPLNRSLAFRQGQFIPVPVAKVSKIMPVMMRFGPSTCKVSEHPSNFAQVLRLRNELTRAKAEVKSLKNELQQRERLDRKRLCTS